MQPTSSPLRRGSRPLGLICAAALLRPCAAQRPSLPPMLPVIWVNATCPMLDTTQLRPERDGEEAADEAAAAAAVSIRRSTTVYQTMSVWGYTPIENPVIILANEYVEVSYVSVVTSINDLPPATSPTEWPYALATTMIADVFPVTRRIWNNLNIDPEKDPLRPESVTRCPKVVAGPPTLAFLWHSTKIHYSADPDIYLPAGVAFPPEISAAAAAAAAPGGMDDEEGTAEKEEEEEQEEEDDEASGVVVPWCSEDMESMAEMDPECEAGGWEDTACLGQCPEVDGELVCSKEYLNLDNLPAAEIDADERPWFGGAWGRACWSYGDPTYKMLNKPCLQGDHWIGCQPGKGYDASWRPLQPDNSDFEW